MRSTTSLLWAVLILAAAAGQGQPIGGKKALPPNPVVVQVVTLRDAGGLSAVSANGNAINVSYTEAIRRYLAGLGYTVVDKGARWLKPAYSVEGDLSHLPAEEPTPGESGGSPYLCDLRLFDENAGHKLIGEWSGEARNLRYLTANLSDTPGVDAEGLLGEMGGKVADAIGASSDANGASTFAKIIDVASQSDFVDAFPVSTQSLSPAKGGGAGIGQPEPSALDHLTSGQAYRLQVRSTHTGNVVLIALGPGGEPLEATSDDDAYAPILAGSPIAVPSKGLTAPVVTAPVNVKIVVLERLIAAGTADTPPDVELPVRLLPNSTPLVLPPVKDASVARLLKTILTDPAHTWVAHVVTLHVSPK